MGKARYGPKGKQFGSGFIPAESMKSKERRMFGTLFRNVNCLSRATQHVTVRKLNPEFIRHWLAQDCATVEHQFIKLRYLTQLDKGDYHQRFMFAKSLLKCISKHHGVLYEGILFGSTVNGLGFMDSDVDLRLRRLREVGDGLFEPVQLDEATVTKTLRDIAFYTRACCSDPVKGEFVPSVRCPVAKLKFFHRNLSDFKQKHLIEGLNFDVSLSDKNSLGSFNSLFLKFLCHLQPKFHLLAIALRYWSKRHALIQPGDLSSYALINMLIFFCQTVQPPLLPTVDEMRQMALDNSEEPLHDPEQAISQLDWHRIVCLKDLYPPCKNHEPLSILLLKFFEFYLTFPYKTHIITIRPGRALDHHEFEAGPQFHPRFQIKKFVNIQDPFDLKHNLTSGLEGNHFNLLMVTIRHSYEKLYKELMDRFYQPRSMVNDHLVASCGGQGRSESNGGVRRNGAEVENNSQNQANNNNNNDGNSDNNNLSAIKRMLDKERNWGLNVIFTKLTVEELQTA